MLLAEVDCCHIVRGLPNESHKVRIDVDFRVVRVRESRKSHMILPIPKLTWRKTIALQQTCQQCEQANAPREYVLQDPELEQTPELELKAGKGRRGTNPLLPLMSCCGVGTC